MTAVDGSRLTGVVALVTGGSRGIGEGCVECFHAAGASVVFCSNDSDGGRALASRLGEDRTMFVEADCRVEADIRRVVSKAVERFGGIDCLVNNVGTHPPTQPIDAFTAGDFRSLLELNVICPFIFSQAALPYLRRSQRCPSIVNIGSLVSSIGQPGAVTYVATKGAIEAMTRALAIDEAAHGVRVNTISPSNIDTPLMRSAIEVDCGGDKEKVAATFSAISKQQLIGRMGTRHEVGSVCVFLASKDAQFVSGVNIPLSYGSELGYAEKSMIKSDS